MAAEVQLKIVADAAQANEQTKGLKQQLREATKEAQALIAAGKENTAEYQNARNAVAQLQDKMRDFNDELKALDPGAKFQAIAGVTSSIAGGFAAAQGAMALFGAESQEVEKALLKVQSAMAIAQGLDQVRELGKYMNLAKLAITGAGESLGRMRTALIATGVGAFAIAVGAIAANWDEFRKMLLDTFPSLEKVGKFFENFKRIAMGTLSSILEGFKVVGEVIADVFRGEFSEAINTAGQFGARVSAAYNKGYLEQQRKEEAVILEAQKKAQDEKLKAEQEAARKRLEEQKKAYEAALKAEEEYTRKRREMVAAENAAYNQQVKNYNTIRESEEAQAQTNLTQLAAFSAEEQRKIREARIQAEIAAEQQAYETKVALEQAKYNAAASAANALSSLGNLIIADTKKAEKFQKTVALIQIAIDTARAISSALVTANAPTPDNVASGGIAGIAKYAALAATILANALRAKQIVQGAGSSGNISFSPAPAANIGGGFGGTGTPQAPVNAFTPQGARTTITNQEGQGANALGQIQVFVTEGDISTTQQRVGSIRKKATVVQ